MSPSVTPVPPPYSPPTYVHPMSFDGPSRAPPPYRAPPPPVSTPSPRPPPISFELESEFSRSEECITDNDSSYNNESIDANQEPPPVPPRRKSSDKLKMENKENLEELVKRSKTFAEDAEPRNAAEGETAEAVISVKERMQKFNRLSELPKAPVSTSNLRKLNKGNDDDDSVSVTSTISLDAKSREWLVLAAKADYHGLAKLATENPRLAKMRDPTSGYTALHWAAKHNNEHIVRLIAGTYGANVNVRTNGGYTALHIAMQYNHENIYTLLVKGYGADRDLMDWSGRKARQYQTNQNTSVSADTFRSESLPSSSMHGYPIESDGLHKHHNRLTSLVGKESFLRKNLAGSYRRKPKSEFPRL